MATEWMNRRDSSMPFQEWQPFDASAIVQVRNCYGDTRIGPSKSFWWGYEEEMGQIGEGVIVKARQLSRCSGAMGDE